MPDTAKAQVRCFMRAAGTPCGLLERPDAVPGARGGPRAGAPPAGGQAGAARPGPAVAGSCRRPGSAGATCRPSSAAERQFAVSSDSGLAGRCGPCGSPTVGPRLAHGEALAEQPIVQFGGQPLDFLRQLRVGFEFQLHIVELMVRLGLLERRLPVLADEHERGKEDRFQGHRECQGRPRPRFDEQHPDGEQNHVDVDEFHGPGESGDPIGDPQLDIRGALRLLGEHDRIAADLARSAGRRVGRGHAGPSSFYACAVARSSNPTTMSEMPRNNARKPTQKISSTARAGNICWEAQNRIKISRRPATVPSHQAWFTSLADRDVMRSRLPRKINSSPTTSASAQNAPNGLENAQRAPTKKSAPIRMCSQRQAARIEAITISLNAPSKKTTPISTPTVATDAMENRKTISEISSQATPDTRKIHHGPASLPSIAGIPAGQDEDRPFIVRSLQAAQPHRPAA